MGSLSKDMLKLTKEKDFLNVQKQFNEAMLGVEMQTEQIESFMDDTESAFSTLSSTGSEADNKEIESLFTNAATDSDTESMIDMELAALKKKIDAGI